MANEYGNYTVFDELDPTPTTTLSNGNRLSTITGSNQNQSTTLAIPSTGKWSCQFKVTAIASGGNPMVGLVGDNNAFYALYRFGGQSIVASGSGADASYGDTYAVNDFIDVLYDADADSLAFRKNGEDQGVAFTAVRARCTGEMFFGVRSSTATTVELNSGQTAFDTAIKSGYATLNTANLPEPDPINYEDEYFIKAGISHSNGSTTAVTLPKNVSGGAMARIKETDGATDWYVFDTVRGVNKSLKYNDDDEEDTSTFDDQNLTGTTLTLPSALASGTYLIEIFYVGSYFQIKTYTGNATNRTISFAGTLDTNPGFILHRDRSGGSTVAMCWHSSLTNTSNMIADQADAVNTSQATYQNSTAPTTTQFSLGTLAEANGDGLAFVCYAWANSGPYQFGTYVGNGGNGDAGPFINVGGAPQSFFAKKLASSTIGWVHHARQYNDPANANETDQFCSLNTANAIGESTGTSGGVGGDFVSTGWKHRGGFTDMNESGVTIIYGAFGIQPLTDGGVNQSKAK